ncbi:hypothetical protein I9W82_000638 [Candida metapsilosis]|uniref:Reduced meiotic recombination protein 1 n=1 Tax=Candida metapsilosis TaxID=273372 RepID=A0A8H7ZLB9_9ASCO|nr:hypothetical protein I9W82_000638 [Candida metapsilosis]
MSESANPNTEHGEASENPALQNVFTGSINSENSSTANFIDSNSIASHDQPEIVVTDDQGGAGNNGSGNIKQVATTEFSESNEAVEGEPQVEQVEVAVSAPEVKVDQVEETVSAPEVYAAEENIRQETEEGKVEEIKDVVGERSTETHEGEAEEQLEYDEEEEEKIDEEHEKAQPQSTTEGVSAEQERDLDSTNAGNREDTVQEESSTNVNTETDDLESQHKPEDVKLDSEAAIAHSSSTANGEEIISREEGKGSMNEVISTADQEGDKSVEATNDSEVIEVVMANGKEEEIELDETVPNPDEDKQYAKLEQNPNEHFDEGMDDINTLVEDVPNLTEKADVKIPIYLKHKNSQFLLFRSESHDEPNPIFEDESSEDISLEEFFGILRTVPEFNFQLDEEIILSIPQFGGISVTEDNVYCKDLQLSDFFDVYHKLCDCTTEKEKVPKQLDFRLTTQPRFIMRYNSLVDSIKQKRGFENISNVDYADDEVEESRKKRKL